MGEAQESIVVAAVIRRDGKLLVGLRPPMKRHGGMWEFPGGKLDEGETLASAARRELREELDLEVVAVGETRLVVRDPGSPFAIHFVEVEVQGTPIPHEHAELRWCSPEELTGMRLAPADLHFALRLVGGNEAGESINAEV